MSVYSNKTGTWRYDFTLNKERYTGSGFKTKREARKAEAARREEVLNPPAELATLTPTVTTFLDLVNLWLDHMKDHRSKSHFEECFYMARNWVKRWPGWVCDDFSKNDFLNFLRERRMVSAYTANKEIRYLRAVFNFGIGEKLVNENPTIGLEFFKVEKKVKKVPCQTEIEKVIEVAQGCTRDYLIVIRETLARVSEVNRLVWDDVDFSRKVVVLYTRKKRDGDLTPRIVPMTKRLYEVLFHRYKVRDKGKPWVFWRKAWNRKKGAFEVGPYGKRQGLMKSLCRRAGVEHFGYHSLRHAGASLLDSCNVSIGSIQRLLGHENRKTTEIYLHSVGNSERVAMDVFEEARGAFLEKSHNESHNFTFEKSP